MSRVEDGGGRGVLPVMACTGRPCLKGYLFKVSGIVHERAGFSQVEFYERGMEICHFNL